LEIIESLLRHSKVVKGPKHQRHNGQVTAHQPPFEQTIANSSEALRVKFAMQWCDRGAIK